VKVIVQRVHSASVTVNGNKIGEIDKGLVLLIGVAENDSIEDVEFVANKCADLRIFPDDDEKMNCSVLEVNGEILAISQFTLLGNTKKGRRPSFIEAASPEKGEEYYNQFINILRDRGLIVKTGIFGAMMDVALVNAGPVTIIVESK